MAAKKQVGVANESYSAARGASSACVESCASQRCPGAVGQSGHLGRTARAKGLALIAAALCLAAVLAGCSSSEPYNPEMTGSTSLSSSDLVTAGQLTVGVNTGNAPLAGTTSAGIVGIDVDIAYALGDEMGLPVSIVDVGSNAVNALKNKKVDVVLGIESTDKSSDIAKSSKYMETGTALFASSPSATIPTKDSGSKIGVQSSSVSSWTVTDEFGTSSVMVESNLNTAFSDLQKGTVQYVAADAVIGSYAAESSGVDAYIIALIGQPTGYCAGTLSTNTNMKKAIETAVSTIASNGVADTVKSKWLGTSLDFSDTKVITTTSASASPSASSETDATAESTSTDTGATGTGTTGTGTTGN